MENASELRSRQAGNRRVWPVIVGLILAGGLAGEWLDGMRYALDTMVLIVLIFMFFAWREDRSLERQIVLADIEARKAAEEAAAAYQAKLKRFS
jgi:hypothetical protein